MAALRAEPSARQGGSPHAAQNSSAADPTHPTFDRQTLRLIVHQHASASRVRLRLSNTFGDRAVTFGQVRVGLRSSGAALVAGTNRPVTFGGETSVTVAAGAETKSDNFSLTVAAGQDLAVSLYVSGPTGPATWHHSAAQTSYVSVAGDHTADTGASAFPTTTSHWFFLDAVNLRSSTSPGTVVALGDSITDGSGSTANTNRRWPDFLSARLLARSGGPKYPVVDEGIGGNKVLTDSATSGVSALHRLTRDVLVRHGLRYVVLLEDINDLRGAHAPSADLIAGYQQIISRVHDQGARIIGATLTPVKGCGGYTADLETRRQAVNRWIRTSGQFDGVIDFDRATQDPADPLRFLPRYDSGDHLHPNDAGYQAMGAAVDLALFQ